MVLRGAGAFGEDNWEEISIGSKGATSITLVSKTTRCLVSVFRMLYKMYRQLDSIAS
jgi:hypothetical protein